MKNLIIKSILTLAVILSSHPVFASGVVVKRTIPGDALIADNPAWTGTKYDGAMIKASNAVGVSSNINYITQIIVQKGSAINVKLIGDPKMKVQSGAVVQINLQTKIPGGNVSYDNAVAIRNAWKRVLPSSYVGAAVTFEDSGIVANNQIVESILMTNPPLCDAALNCAPGNITIRLSMPLDVYETIFEPALNAWDKSSKKASYPISGQGLSGTLIQYKINK